MYDVIGDIHGYADRLQLLLTRLGYRESHGNWKHPTRTAVFLGDFIDRGPEQPRTVAMVRAMVENGDAIALMGNHEFNAILYNTKGADGSYLREPGGEGTSSQEALYRYFSNGSGGWADRQW